MNIEKNPAALIGALLERQTDALERIAKSLGLIAACLEDLWDKQGWQVRESRPEQPEANETPECFYCRRGDHAKCVCIPAIFRLSVKCHCSVCHQAPALTPPFLIEHEYAGEEALCTECGGGRLHPIHQV